MQVEIERIQIGDFKSLGMSRIANVTYPIDYFEFRVFLFYVCYIVQISSIESSNLWHLATMLHGLEDGCQVWTYFLCPKTRGQKIIQIL